MRRRLSPVILLVGLLFLKEATAVRAQLVWTGTNNANAGDISNYTGSLSSPNNVTFDDVDVIGSTTGLYGSLGTLGSIYFTGVNRQNYTFDNATLTLQNDIIVQPTDSGAPISFGSNYNITLTSTGHTIDVGSTNMEILGTIYDSGGYGATIYKNGAGSLTLSGANEFTGGVVVNTGVLYLGSSSGSYQHFNGETYDTRYTGPVGGSSSILTMYNGTTLGVAASVDGGLVSLDNNINLNSDGGTVTLDTTNGDLTLNGFISGASALSKIGSGTLTLNDYNNTFNGGLTVTAGTLLLGGSSYFDGEVIVKGPVGTGDLTMFSGTTLGVGDYAEGSATLDNNIVLDSGTVTIDTDNGNLNLKGIISENDQAGLAVQGGGTLTLSGRNTYSGGTSVSGGSTLLLGSTSSYSYDSELETYTINYGPIGTGDIKLYDGTTLGVAPGMNFVELANNVVLDCRSGTSVNVDISNLNEGWLEFDGNISGAAAINLLDTAGNEIDFYGNNSSWTGGLNVYGNSYVYAGTDSALGTGPLWFASSSAAQVEFDSSNPSIGGLSGSAPSSEVYLDSGTTLTINQASSGTYSGYITGSGGLVKSGCATLTLTGLNDFAGGTSLNQGTLVAGSNSALGTGTVTFNGGKLSVASGVTLMNPLNLTNGGTLSGNGTIGTAITAGTGVIIAPGNSPGNLTFSAGLAWSAGGEYDWQFQTVTGSPGVNADLITVSGGTLDLPTAPFTLKLISLNLAGTPGDLDPTSSLFVPGTSYTWLIAEAPGGITNPAGLANITIDPSAATFNGTSLTGYGSFSLGIGGGNTELDLNFTPVPEPSTYALLTLGLSTVALPFLRRRQRG